MASIIKVDKLDPQSGTALEIGTSGDTVTVPTGAGLTVVDEVKTNKISPATGVAFAMGDSGDTFTVASGAALKIGTEPVKVAGKETMWVPATAMYATTSNGAEAAQAELTATNPELKTFAFDTTTAEYTQFNVCFPKSWDESTVTFQTFWSASATDTGTGGFKLQGVSIANNIDYDTAFGTAVANTALAASGTQDDLMVNVESGDVTIASAAVDTNTIFQIVRDVAADTNTGDLRLVGVKIFYTTDAANDA